MKTLVINYLRRFVGLAIDWRERYKTDILFRSTAGVSLLLVSFALVCIILFTILALNHASVWLALLSMVVVGSVYGFLFIRFMLLPTRDTLHYQKLFISNVAHELRTPLSTIKTSTEVALLDDRLTSPTVKVFREIVAELDRISEIIDNLLSLDTLTRPERMRFGNVDLTELVELIASRYRPLAHERGIILTVKKDAPAIVWGNAGALEQVIMHLIKNALIYTRKNSKGKVTISLHPDYQGSIICTVADNGIGIAERDLAHIFEPFYRADTSRVRNVKSTGSGLGLAIVNEIIRAHHGKINIQSAKSEGTVVSVVLPLGVTKAMAKDISHTKGEKSHVSLDFSKHVSSPF